MEELRKQQRLLAAEQIKVRRLLYLMGVGVATVILMFAIIIVYIVVASQGQRETSCSVVAAAKAEKQAQLAALDETPPTTDAGRGIQRAAQDSLRAWEGLSRQLHCKG